MDTLTDLVRGLEPRLLQTLSTLAIEIRDGEAWATLSFLLLGPVGTSRGITVDTDDLPAGVTLSGWERWPDREARIAMSPPIVAQLADLDASGLVGHLDVARFDAPANDAGHPRYRWVVKTHAGTQSERNRWALSLDGEPHRRSGPPSLTGTALNAPVNIRLTAAQTRKARDLGGGSIAAGVRAALDALSGEEG